MLTPERSAGLVVTVAALAWPFQVCDRLPSVRVAVALLTVRADAVVASLPECVVVFVGAKTALRL